MALETYAHLSEQVATIRNRMGANRDRKGTAFINVDAAVVDLGKLAGDYAGVSSSVNTQAAANPDDSAWQSLKASKDLLLAEYQVQETDAQGLQTAMGPFIPAT